jgi:subtilisin family serine protease
MKKEGAKMNAAVRIYLVWLLAMGFGMGGGFHRASAEDLPEYEPDEVVVKLVQTGDLESVAADFQLALPPLDQFGERPIYRLAILDGATPPEKAEELLGDSRVLYAEPNYFQQTPEGQQRISWARGGSAGEYAAQWAGAYLGLSAAHSVTRGEGVIVAVLDTGIDRTHPALAGRVLQGYDFVEMDAIPDEVGVSGTDVTYGHGTHVAGLVALAAPDAQILPVRVLDRDGAGNLWVLAEALAYAVNPDGDLDTPDGAQVINLSISTLRRTALLNEIVRDVICADDDDDDDDNDDDDENDDDRRRADDDDECLASAGRGAVVVAAAGNRGSSTPEYPAAEGLAGLLAVAAHTENGALADFSNRGAWVHVAAPGDRILSSVPASEYGVWSGTSMAAPLVAGQAALVRAANPLSGTVEVVVHLQRTASPAAAGEGPPQVDAAAAVGLRATERPLVTAEWVYLPKVSR